jgi:DNA-binding MarR family transcriptional regulator
MDKEARLQGTTPAEHPEALRLWLRMLTCTQLIETRVRAALREQFDTTLPRFDLMAQLERAPEGLKMNELSRRMMVTGGNVTAITDQLVSEGLVQRCDVAGDRRAYRVQLTPAGRAHEHARPPRRAVKGAWDLHFILSVGPSGFVTSALIQRLILVWRPSMVGFRLLVKESMKPYA